jgi:hypothetical protein
MHPSILNAVMEVQYLYTSQDVAYSNPYADLYLITLSIAQIIYCQMISE